jgi:hypothetical protein
MTFVSGVPGWVAGMFAFMIVMQVMRAVFGRARSRVQIPRRWELFDRQEVERLDAAISQRDDVIEDLQQRLSELESRADFAERMIANRSDEPAPKEQVTIGH